MGQVEERIKQLGLVLPLPMQLPPGVSLPFPWVRVVGQRVFVSGHGPQAADGSIPQPLGKVGRDLTVDEAVFAARLAGLSILSSLKRAIGDLDRIDAWLRVFGMVNCAPGFTSTPTVINGFTDLIIDIFGKECGQHSRSAVGMAELPFNIPVEIEAEVSIR